MKKATKTKDYTELDEAIRIKVAAMAYNKGQGKCINVHTLVARRNAEKPLSKQVRKFKSVIEYLVKNATKIRGKWMQIRKWGAKR
jgi:hypothetical protein